MLNEGETIVALATAAGTSAIAIVRMSGNKAISIADRVFRSFHGKDLANQKSHTIHLGHVMQNDSTLDEVLLSLFKGPNSYTGEDVVEISCHGSIYIPVSYTHLTLPRILLV